MLAGRAFALIGSSLFYAKDRSALTAQPKIFAEIHNCEVQSWSENVTGHSHVFAIRLHKKKSQRERNGISLAMGGLGNGSGHGDGGDEDFGGSVEMLLLAADTPRDKYAWVDAIARASVRCWRSNPRT